MRLDDFPDQPFTTSRARQLGLSDRQLRGLVARGEVRRVCHGVYVLDRVPDSVALRAQALGLVLPPGSAVCRRTAAWLYGIDARPIGGQLKDPPVEILVDLEGTVVNRPGIRGYSATLFGAEEVVEVEGCRVTSPLRTATDLGRWLPRLEAAAAIDQFLHLGLIDLDAMVEEVARFARHRGVRQLAFVVRIADPLAESPGESWLRVVIVDAGLPRPRAQIELCDATGRVVYRMDMGYDDVQLGLEYMGIKVHTGGDAVASDRRRRARIETEYGWQLEDMWMNDVLGRRPTAPRRVAEALLARGVTLPDRVLERIGRGRP